MNKSDVTKIVEDVIRDRLNISAVLDKSYRPYNENRLEVKVKLSLDNVVISSYDDSIGLD